MLLTTPPPPWKGDPPGYRLTSHGAIGADADVDGTGPVNSILQDIFGVNTASSILGIQEIMTGTPAFYNTGLQIKAVANFNSDASTHIAVESLAATHSSYASNVIIVAGFFGGVSHRGSGTISAVYGVPGVVYNTGGGTMSQAAAVYGVVNNGATGTISFGSSLYAANNQNGGGTFTTNNGLYIENQTGGVTNYNIYSAGGTADNYLEGYVRTSSTGGFYMNAAGSVNNRLKINEPTSAVATAECIITPSATTRTPMVYQALASQSASLNEWQDSTGAVLLSVGAGGNLTFAEGINIIAGTSTGTKIGTATSQKLGFYNATPVVQQGSDANSLVTLGFNSSLSALTFTKEVAALIRPAASTTAATAGASVSMVGGAGSTVTSGAGGGAIVTGGAAQAGNSNGGAVTLTGGASVGVATGGGVTIAGGAGLTGGNVTINSGSGVADGNIRLATTDGMVNVGSTSTPTAMLHVRARIADTTTLEVDNLTNTGAIAQFKDNGTVVASLADGGAALFQNSTNSVTAFKVMDSGGGTSVFDVDTTNERVGIGTDAPAKKLHIVSNTPLRMGTATDYVDYGQRDVNKWGWLSSATGDYIQTWDTASMGWALGGSTYPTATLHIVKAGTTAASSAPLKFTTGTNMTSPEAGAFEFSSSVLYFTPSASRYTVLLSTLPEAQDITVGTSTGTKIGTATSQKLAFYNSTPVIQQSGDVRTILTTLGLASSATTGERVNSVADATSITPSIDSYDITSQTNTQALGTLTINAPTGTPRDGQEHIIRIKSTNVQTFSFNATYTGSTDTPLPISTYGGATWIYMKFKYNSTESEHHLIAVTDGY